MVNEGVEYRMLVARDGYFNVLPGQSQEYYRLCLLSPPLRIGAVSTFLRAQMGQLKVQPQREDTSTQKISADIGERENLSRATPKSAVQAMMWRCEELQRKSGTPTLEVA